MTSNALDMTDTIEPRSDQMNADDLMSGPRTFTIAEVRKSGSAEQPVDVVLVEFPNGRPFKPSKSMRRVMVAAWGPDAAGYAGHRMTLYRDPKIRFGGQEVGGIRISHMSGIGKRLTLALTVTRGKRAPYVVEPLPDDHQPAAVVCPETLAELAGLFEQQGIPEAQQLPGVNAVIGGGATGLETITEDQAQQVLASLRGRLGGGPVETREPAAAPASEVAPGAPPTGGEGRPHAGDGGGRPEPRLSGSQRAAITAAFTRLKTPLDDRLTYMTELVGRDLPSGSDLTAAEAEQVLEVLGKVKSTGALQAAVAAYADQRGESDGDD